MSRYNDNAAVKIEQLTPEVEQQEQPKLEVRTSKAVRRAVRPYGKYVAIILSLGLAACVLLNSYVSLSVLNLQNSQLRQDIARLEREESALNAKKEQIYKLPYVEAYARDRLGMVKADKSQIDYVEMDTGDRMVITEQAAMPGTVQESGMLDRIAQVFSAVVEYLN